MIMSAYISFHMRLADILYFDVYLLMVQLLIVFLILIAAIIYVAYRLWFEFKPSKNKSACVKGCSGCLFAQGNGKNACAKQSASKENKTPKK